MNTDKRAWDKKRKELFPVHEIKYNKHSGEPIKIIGYTHDEKDIWNVHGGGIMKYANKPRYVVMDYIGCPDKNDKRIYVGDIVKVRHTYDYPTMEGYEREWTEVIGEVAFNNGMYDVKRVDSDGSEVWQGITAMECLTDMLSEWEIIGNIFENPELLEELE